MKNLGAKLEAVVRKYATRAPSEGNTPVDENVSRALSCALGCSDYEHVGPAAGTIGEEHDVGCLLYTSPSPRD